ncbi:MAG: hypothetical protein M3R05_01030 [Chloroflexota bacterium]|nr:hypothetical protein [Chloroflexota bacterium]
MTEINGLRLAYRGLVAGLAGGYIWLAVAMLMSWPITGPLTPVRLLAAIGPDRVASAPGTSLILALVLVEVSAGAMGMGFAYFLGRYFTVRGTVAAAAPCFALLAWLSVSERLGISRLPLTMQVGLAFATLLYGALLGAAIPIRPELVRAPNRVPSVR